MFAVAPSLVTIAWADPTTMTSELLVNVLTDRIAMKVAPALFASKSRITKSIYWYLMCVHQSRDYWGAGFTMSAIHHAESV